MNSTSVGISLFVTLMSTLSYLTYRGVDSTWSGDLCECLRVSPHVLRGGMVDFPRIMKMNVTSAYEILEIQLGVTVRILATFIMFLSLRLLRMATIIYVIVDVKFWPGFQQLENVQWQTNPLLSCQYKGIEGGCLKT